MFRKSSDSTVLKEGVVSSGLQLIFKDKEQFRNIVTVQSLKEGVVSSGLQLIFKDGEQYCTIVTLVSTCYNTLAHCNVTTLVSICYIQYISMQYVL